MDFAPASRLAYAADDAQVVCVYWGDKYSPIYVEKLCRAVRRHLEARVPFVCLTEPRRERFVSNVQCIPSPTDWPGWWQKIHLFDRRVMGKRYVIFIDLDVVILKSLMPIVAYLGRFDFVYAWDPLDYLSSSFMVIDTHSELARKIINGFKPSEWIGTDKSDQDYLRSFAGQCRYRDCRLPPEIHYSYKCLINHDGWAHRLREPSERITNLSDIVTLNFHGYPKQQDLVKQRDKWKYAEAILSHWT